MPHRSRRRHTAPAVTTSVESRFPDGLHFDVTITGPVEIAEARVRFRVLGEQVTRNAPLEFEPGRRVQAGLLVRTDTAQRYIPPGAEIEYSVDVTDATGARTESATERTVFLDPRFEWSRIDAPGVYLLYYGGQEGRARRALEAAQDALVQMSDLMGIEERDTLRLTVYNTISAMRDALPPRSVVQESVRWSPRASPSGTRASCCCWAATRRSRASRPTRRCTSSCASPSGAAPALSPPG